MSSAWSWFVIIGTLGTLIATTLLLLANLKTSGEETTGHDSDGIQELDNPLPMWWVGMFLFTIVYAVGYLIWYPGLGNITGIAGWTSLDQWQQEVDQHDARFAPTYARLGNMTAQQLRDDRVAQQVGRRLFINNCSTCHGVTAQGGFGFPDLTDGEWIWGEGFDAIKQSIMNGRIAVMPPWGAALGDSGVAEVTQYTLSMAGRDHDQEAALRGKSQYDILCVACHGPEGGGNPLFGAPDPFPDLRP